MALAPGMRTSPRTGWSCAEIRSMRALASALVAAAGRAKAPAGSANAARAARRKASLFMVSPPDSPWVAQAVGQDYGVFSMTGDSRRSAPHVARNAGPIAKVLAGVLPERGLVLELASGTGEHALHFAGAFP